MAPRDADACPVFLKTTFEGVVINETLRPNGTLMHTALRIGESNARVLTGKAPDARN